MIIESASQIIIRILEARNLKATDSNGFSDPYVKILQSQAGGKPKTIHKTAVIKKTLNPEWKNESVRISSHPTLLEFVVKDHNTFKSSIDLGSVELNMEFIFGKDVVSYDEWLPLTNGQGELHISASLSHRMTDTESIRSFRSFSMRKLSNSSLSKQ